MTEIFFTSDTHFGCQHQAMFKALGCVSPSDRDDMLTEQWNAEVGLNDIVYHLGDFCDCDTSTASFYFEQLHGNIKMLALPFHNDAAWLSLDVQAGLIPMFTYLTNRVEFVGQIFSFEGVICSHWPLMFWNGDHHFHGHMHGKYKSKRQGVRDVSVFTHPEHRPWNIKELLNEKTFS